jgi:hypothetical protein
MYGTDRRWYTLLSGDKTLHCWLTNPVPDIYTKDMATVGGSIYYRMPLNYVSGRKSRRLYEKYSLKVRQISLGENAFWYWSELAKNTQSGGELFSSQPALTPSNIYKLNDPEAQIIGYFSVAGATEKRILVSSLPEVDIYRDPYICAPGVMPMFLWRYPQDKLPFFVASVDLFGEFMSGEVRDECVDCRLYKRSTDQKPDYW